jgi:hypothetical protein
MNLTVGSFINEDIFTDMRCSHNISKMSCQRCQIFNLLCINHYDRQLPWLPKDVCKLIFKQLIKLRPWWKAVAAEAA